MVTMTTIKKLTKMPTIHNLQEFVDEQKSSKNKHRQKYFLKLIEEVGELSQMLKNDQRIDPDSDKLKAIKHTMEEEMADVLFYLLALANAWDVDLEKAFIHKITYRYED
jgi:NTP pyrophosphatase (non-canonical NTP hydrolase)